MIILLIILPLIILILSIIANDISIISVYGFPIKNRKKWSNYLKTNEFFLNSLSKDIILPKDLDNTPYFYISKVRSSILFKYYIEDQGVIFRWSKLNKEIKEKYKELNLKN